MWDTDSILARKLVVFRFSVAVEKSPPCPFSLVQNPKTSTALPPSTLWVKTDSFVFPCFCNETAWSHVDLFHREIRRAVRRNLSCRNRPMVRDLWTVPSSMSPWRWRTSQPRPSASLERSVFLWVETMKICKNSSIMENMSFFIICTVSKTWNQYVWD